jgi:hypothetical protein
MSTLDQIAGGIETRLKTIAGLNVAKYFPGQIVAPVAIVGVPPVTDYHASMGRGTMSLEPTIHIFTGSAIDLEGQRMLSEYANPVGSKSIRAAVEGDKTLGGLVQDCIVREFRPLNLEEYSALNYYGGVFTLQLYARGNS